MSICPFLMSFIVEEEKKVLYTVYALLVSSSTKLDEESLLATKAYSQTNPGLNDPILKVMNYGYAKKEGVCDLTVDEKNSEKMRNHWTL